jgi:hypothetical protein
VKAEPSEGPKNERAKLNEKLEAKLPSQGKQQAATTTVTSLDWQKFAQALWAPAAD